MFDKFKKFRKYLGIKKPVDILLKDSERKDATAFHEPIFSDVGKLKRHRITVYARNLNKSERSIETLLAHELIHAWQAENGATDIHGASFAKMARPMSERFGLPDIYIPSVDSD